MQLDASSAMQRLVHARPPSTKDCRPSLTYSDFTETAVHREIANIYKDAKPPLKAWYNIGYYWQDGNNENWVIRWAIYKSFRNSVNRGRSRTGGSINGTSAKPVGSMRSSAGIVATATPNGSVAISTRTLSQAQGICTLIPGIRHCSVIQSTCHFNA